MGIQTNNKIRIQPNTANETTTRTHNKEGFSLYCKHPSCTPPRTPILPTTTTTHRWANCKPLACDKCHKYTPLIESGTNTPIIPCTYLRCIYLLYHLLANNSTEDPLHFYIAGTSLDIATINNATMIDPIGAILNNRIPHWEILQIFGATYKKTFWSGGQWVSYI